MVKKVEDDLHVTVEIVGNEELMPEETKYVSTFAEKLASLRGVEGFGGDVPDQWATKAMPVVVEPEVVEVVEPVVVEPVVEVVEPVMEEPQVVEVVNENLKVEKTRETDGQQCHAGDTVLVHYTGRLTDGTVFDTSHKRGQPFEFQVGAGMVIQGWDEGIPQLKVGETAILTCSPEYGYGS